MGIRDFAFERDEPTEGFFRAACPVLVGQQRHRLIARHPLGFESTDLILQCDVNLAQFARSPALQQRVERCLRVICLGNCIAEFALKVVRDGRHRPLHFVERRLVADRGLRVVELQHLLPGFDRVLALERAPSLQHRRPKEVAPNGKPLGKQRHDAGFTRFSQRTGLPRLNLTRGVRQAGDQPETDGRFTRLFSLLARKHSIQRPLSEGLPVGVREERVLKDLVLSRRQRALVCDVPQDRLFERASTDSLRPAQEFDGPFGRDVPLEDDGLLPVHHRPDDGLPLHRVGDLSDTRDALRRHALARDHQRTGHKDHVARNDVLKRGCNNAGARADRGLAHDLRVLADDFGGRDRAPHTPEVALGRRAAQRPRRDFLSGQRCGHRSLTRDLTPLVRDHLTELVQGLVDRGTGAHARVRHLVRRRHPRARHRRACARDKVLEGLCVERLHQFARGLEAGQLRVGRQKPEVVEEVRLHTSGLQRGHELAHLTCSGGTRTCKQRTLKQREDAACLHVFADRLVCDDGCDLIRMDRAAEAESCSLNPIRADAEVVGHTRLDAGVEKEVVARLRVTCDAPQRLRVRDARLHRLLDQVRREDVLRRHVRSHALRGAQVHQEVDVRLLRRPVQKVLDGAHVLLALAHLDRVREGFRVLPDLGHALDGLRRHAHHARPCGEHARGCVQPLASESDGLAQRRQRPDAVEHLHASAQHHRVESRGHPGEVGSGLQALARAGVVVVVEVGPREVGAVPVDRRQLVAKEATLRDAKGNVAQEGFRLGDGAEPRGIQHGRGCTPDTGEGDRDAGGQHAAADHTTEDVFGFGLSVSDTQAQRAVHEELVGLVGELVLVGIAVLVDVVEEREGAQRSLVHQRRNHARVLEHAGQGRLKDAPSLRVNLGKHSLKERIRPLGDLLADLLLEVRAVEHGARNVLEGKLPLHGPDLPALHRLFGRHRGLARKRLNRNLGLGRGTGSTVFLRVHEGLLAEVHAGLTGKRDKAKEALASRGRFTLHIHPSAQNIRDVFLRQFLGLLQRVAFGVDVVVDVLVAQPQERIAQSNCAFGHIELTPKDGLARLEGNDVRVLRDGRTDRRLDLRLFDLEGRQTTGRARCFTRDELGKARLPRHGSGRRSRDLGSGGQEGVGVQPRNRGDRSGGLPISTTQFAGGLADNALIGQRTVIRRPIGGHDDRRRENRRRSGRSAARRGVTLSQLAVLLGKREVTSLFCLKRKALVVRTAGHDVSPVAPV